MPYLAYCAAVLYISSVCQVPQECGLRYDVQNFPPETSPRCPSKEAHPQEALTAHPQEAHPQEAYAKRL